MRKNTVKQVFAQVATVAVAPTPVAVVPTLLLGSSVAPQQFAAPQHTVVQPATLRAARMLRVTNMLYSKRVAAKQATNAVLLQQRNLAAYNAAVAALQLLHGVAPTQQVAINVSNNTRTLNGYATNIVAKQPPSVAPGSCAQVHQIAAQYGFNRAATLRACMVAGINPATAATQFNIARKRNIAAQQG